MWNGEKQDNFDIYLKQIGADTLLRVTTDPEKDFGPAWSPDGRSIAFGRRLLSWAAGQNPRTYLSFWMTWVRT